MNLDQAPTAENYGPKNSRYESFKNKLLAIADYAPDGDHNNSVDALFAHLTNSASEMSNDRDSLYFSEEGTFQSPKDIKDTFIKLLHEEGYHPATIYGVADRHLKEPLLLVNQAASELFAIKEQIQELKTKTDAENVFAKAMGTGSTEEDTLRLEVLETAYNEQKRKRDVQVMAFFHFQQLR